MNDEVTAIVIRYDRTNYEELCDVPLENIGSLRERDKNLWVRIEGIIRPEILERIGSWATLDRIDMNTILAYAKEGPRLAQFDKCAFMSWKYAKRINDGIEEKEIQIIIGRGFVVSFEMDMEDANAVKDLLKEGTRIRKMPASFLLYSILDTTINDFFDYTKYLGRRIDDLQEDVLRNSQSVIGELLKLRAELSSMWLSVWDLGEIASALHERKYDLIDDSVKHHFEDLKSRIGRLTQMIESTRQVVPQVISLYQNDLSNQLNKIVRVLTVVTVIFTPSMVITAWYGMNFRFMPELGSTFGYPAVILTMFGISLALTIYFWRKKWV